MIEDYVEQKICNMYEAGVGGTTIAKNLNVTTRKVYGTLEKHDINRRKRISIVATEIAGKINNAMTIGEISVEMNLQTRTIAIILKQIEERKKIIPS